MVRTALALSILLALPSAGVAGTVSTAPLVVHTGHNFLCGLTNLGTKATRAVAVEILEFSSFGGDVTVVATSPVADVAALAAVALDNGYNGTPPVLRLCRFSFKGSGKSLRASATVIDGTTPLATEPAR
jgi:hypothetical protein